MQVFFKLLAKRLKNKMFEYILLHIDEDHFFNSGCFSLDFLLTIPTTNYQDGFE